MLDELLWWSVTVILLVLLIVALFGMVHVKQEIAIIEAKLEVLRDFQYYHKRKNDELSTSEQDWTC